MAVALKFVSGIADAFISTAFYSIITIEFQTKKEQYSGYAQTALGIGLMLGPVLGSMLYDRIQFRNTFIVIAGIIFLGVFSTILTIPSSINYKKTAYDDEERLEKPYIDKSYGS